LKIKTPQMIKTCILIAWVWSILAIIVSVIYLCWYFIMGLGFGALYNSIFSITAGVVVFLIFIIGPLVLLIASIILCKRLNRMNRAANQGDFETLKYMNSTGWAIFALLVGGVIPGIALLVAHAPIEELSNTTIAERREERVARAPIEELHTTGEWREKEVIDDLDRIGKLKSLLESGAITREEFETQKNLILHKGAVQTPQSKQVSAKTNVVNTQTDIASKNTSVITCSKCGAQDSIDSKFCSSCGSVFPEIKIKSYKLMQRFCPGCGTRNEIDSEFCISCGKKLLA
jgi:ribosomal protein L40E